MTKQIAIVLKLEQIIKLQNEALIAWPDKSADDTREWLTINYLFSVGRQYPSVKLPVRDQLDAIFWRWTSPDPLSLREFASMIETLQELIAADLPSTDVAASASSGPQLLRCF